MIKSLKALFSFSSPLVIAKLGIPLRGLAITWIFAKLGPDALAAGALAYSLFIALVTFLLGVLIASVGVSVAYAVGENDTVKVTKVFHQGFWLGLFLAIPGMILLYNIDPILLLFGQNKTIVSLVSQFSLGLAWTLIPYTILVNAYKLFTNLKKTHIPMFYSFLGLFVTIISSYAFALGKWGLPSMGIAGVGWAIAISYWFQVIIILLRLHLNRATKTYSFFTRFSLPKKQDLHSFWRIGWPVGSKYTVEFLLFFVIAAMIGAKSADQLAVYQVILQFFMLSSCLSSGVGLGVEALAGQAIGGKRYGDVKFGCYAGLSLSTFYIGIVATILLLFSQWTAHFFFTRSSTTLTLFIQVVDWVVFFLFLDSTRKIMTSILVTFKDVQFPLIAELVGLWGISLPFAYCIGVIFHYGLAGFLLGLNFGLFVSVVMMAFRFQQKIKTFNKRSTEKITAQSVIP